MKPLKTLKKEWKKLVAQAPDPHWFTLFEEMKEALNPDSERYNQLVNNERSFRTARGQSLTGGLSFEELNLSYSKIASNLLKIIDAITEADLSVDSQKSLKTSLLDQQIQQLPISRPILPLSLVNCDRKKNRRDFRRTRRSWEAEGLKIHTYIALGCPSQKPDGFAERMVFEILESYEDNYQSAINYPRKPNGRLALERLPVGYNLSLSKQGFIKYFSERFELGAVGFEHYIQHPFLDRQEESVVFPFLVPINDWDGELIEDYVDWIIEQFDRTRQKGPTCVFIFIIQLKNAHQEERLKYDREILEDVQQMVQDKQAQHCFLYPFPEVPRYFLDRWLRDLTDAAAEQYNLDRLINTFLEQRIPQLPKTYNEDDFLIDMEHIQWLQHRIWQLRQATP